MARNSAVGKVLLLLGGLLGIFSIIAYFIDESFGGWWQASWGSLRAYMSPFGLYSDSADLSDSVLGIYGIAGPIIFIIGAILVFIPLFKESRAYGFLGSFLMIGGVVLFLIGLSSVENYEDLLAVLSFLTGSEYNVFFGSEGNISWGLNIGFFMAVIAVVLVLIGSIVYD